MAKLRFGRYSFQSSNEDKVLFPQGGLSKGALMAYYEAVAERILPHLRGRPLTLRRFPDGIAGEGFYQKQIGDYFPDWINRVTVDKVGGGQQTLAVCNNKATLVYLADQAAIGLHPWLSRTDRLNNPDQLVIDLDPPDDDFEKVRAAALQLKALLDELLLPSFVKTTGSRGLHVVVPLDRRSDFDATRAFAKDMMHVLAGRHRDTLTTEQRKRQRAGRVYLDVGRNAYGQTAVAGYSVRPLPGGPVAAPLDWEEVSDNGINARAFNVNNMPDRVTDAPDPWRGLRRRAVSIERAAARLANLAGAD